MKTINLKTTFQSGYFVMSNPTVNSVNSNNSFVNNNNNNKGDETIMQKRTVYTINYALQLSLALSFTNIVGAVLVISIFGNLFPSCSSNFAKYIINDICYFLTGKELFPTKEWERIPGNVINYVDGVPVWVENVDNHELVGKVATQFVEEEATIQTDDIPQMGVMDDNSVRKEVTFKCPVTKEEVTVTVYGDNTFRTSLSPAKFSCREYVIIHEYAAHSSQKDANGEVVNQRIAKIEEVLDIFVSIVPNLKTKASLSSLLEVMETKVIVDKASRPGAYGFPIITHDVLGNPCEDKATYEPIKANRISPIGIVTVDAAITSKFDGVNAGITFCKSDLLGDDYAVAVEYFTPLGIPVLADKQNSSYLTYGNAVSATFTQVVDGELKTITPTSDQTKLLKRLAYHGGNYAESLSYVKTNLCVRGQDGSLIRLAGDPKVALIGFNNHFNNGSGIAIAPQQTKVKHWIPKSLTSQVTITEIGVENFQAFEGKDNSEKLETLRKVVIEQLSLANGTVLNPGDDLTVELFEGVTISLAKNGHNMPVVIHNENLNSTVRLGKPIYRGEVGDIQINCIGKAQEETYVLKGRNAHMKFQLLPKEVEITLESHEIQKFIDLVLSGETNKGSLAVLGAFATQFVNAEAKDMINIIFETNGELVFDCDVEEIPAICAKYLGDEYATCTSFDEAFTLWLKNATRTFTMKQEVSACTVEKYSAFCNERIEFVEENGKQYLVETFEGIVGTVYPLWEVSTPAECAGVNRINFDQQAVLSLYDPKVGEAIQAKVTENQTSLDLLTLNEDQSLANIDKIFDISSSRQELIDFLSIGDNQVNTKAKLGALTNMGAGGYNAIRITWNGHSVDVPLKVVTTMTHWSSAGEPKTAFNPIFDEEGSGEATYSLVTAMTNLFKALVDAKGDIDLTKKALSAWKYHYNGFIKLVVNGNAATNFWSVGKQGHHKVVTDYRVPCSHKREMPNGRIAEYNIPEVWVSPDFWNLKGNHPGNDHKAWLNLVNGDIIVVNRVPVPTAVACRLVVKEDLVLDPGVFLINPIVWSVTLGDADGDYGYVAPISQFGVKGLKKAEVFNDHPMSLGGHMAACKRHRSASPVYDFIGATHAPESYRSKEAFTKAWAELCKEFSDKQTKRATTLVESTKLEEFVEKLEKISENYKKYVGNTHKFMRAAVLATVDHVRKGDEVTFDMWVEVLNKVFLYEQNALAGHSDASVALIQKANQEVKDFIKARRPDFVFANRASKARQVDGLDLVVGSLINTTAFMNLATHGFSPEEAIEAFSSGTPNMNAHYYITWVCASIVRCERGNAISVDNPHILIYALHTLSRKRYSDPSEIASVCKLVKDNYLKGSFFDNHIRGAVDVKVNHNSRVASVSDAGRATKSVVKPVGKLQVKKLSK